MRLEGDMTNTQTAGRPILRRDLGVQTFIIRVRSKLQPDPNEETAALFRVLHNIDNTTFDGDAPALPQWIGPPRMVPQVQASYTPTLPPRGAREVVVELILLADRYNRPDSKFLEFAG